MGMYTELVLNVGLGNDIPPSVVGILKFMTGQSTVTPIVNDDPLFRTDRWEWMLQSASLYFVPQAQSRLIEKLENTYHLSIRCDLKNYSGEIEAFLDWIAPHVENFGDPIFGGYTRYEEDENPTLVYFVGGKVEYHETGRYL